MRKTLFLLLLSLLTGPLVMADEEAKAPPWRALKALAPGLYKREQVCKDAGTAGKPFALVALKAHECDYSGYQYCLKEAYYLSDPCNLSLAGAFALYHLRLEKNDRRKWESKTDWSKQEYARFLAEWGPELDPGWILIDVKTCSVVSKLARKDLHTGTSYASGKMLAGKFTPPRLADDLLEEYTLLAKRLARALGPEKARAMQWNRESAQRCLKETPRPSMIELWDHLDEHRE